MRRSRLIKDTNLGEAGTMIAQRFFPSMPTGDTAFCCSEF